MLSYLRTYFYSNNDLFNKFKNVLEFVPDNKNKIIEKNIVMDDNSNLSIFIKNIDDFCKNKKYKKMIISLSGGVDSMVLISILKFLNYNIIACHINYNNRKDTIDEEEFLKEWCNQNNIKLYVKSINEVKRDNTKRSDYELITKNMRLDFYKETIEKESAEIVLLGHHKDDIVENIFANVCRGRNILDLAVLRKEALINNIKIGRPMLEYNKETIYNFSKKYEIPYFKNTTPDGSVRGKYRNIISKAIEDAFTENVRQNLIGLSIQSDDWNSLINKDIIQPFMNNVSWNIDSKSDNKSISFNIEKYIDYPVTFWSVVFMNLFNNFGLNAPSKKGILTFLTTIKNRIKSPQNTRFNVTLSSNCKCTIKNYNIIIEFKK